MERLSFGDNIFGGWWLSINRECLRLLSWVELFPAGMPELQFLIEDDIHTELLINYD